MSEAYQSININRSRQLAQRAISASTVKEFATIVTEANQTLNWQEWSHFNAECRRLKDESEQRLAAKREERTEYDHSIV